MRFLKGVAPFVLVVIAIIVMGLFWSQVGPVMPRQHMFRALALSGAFLGLVAIWVARFRMRQKVGKRRTRKRVWYAVAGAACLLVGGYYLIRPYHEPLDEVKECKLLVGGGRVYVVVLSTHSVVRTSHLGKMLRWAGGPAAGRVVIWHPSMHILESDGVSARSTLLPEEGSFAEVMPVGRDLYVILALGKDEIKQWRDGQLVSVAAPEGAKILHGLADDLAVQCAAQGWEFTLLAGDHANALSKIIALGDRNVRLELALVRETPNSPRLLHARIEVPGTEALVQTFPPDPLGGL